MPIDPARRTTPWMANRKRDLGRLLPLWPSELDDTNLAGRLRLLSRLRAALRAERQRGIAGHWSYDLARHRALLNAYRAEAQNILDLGWRLPTSAKPIAITSRDAYRGPSSSQDPSGHERS